MPKIMLPIPEIEDTVTRPVVVSIARELSEAIRLQDNISILYPGAEERAPLYNSTVNKNNKDISKFPHTNQISIEVEEEVEEDNVLNRAVLRNENIPIFRDDVLRIMVRPVYVHTTTTLNFTSRFTDKSAAQRWLAEMRNKVSLGRIMINHKATYSYAIPPEFTIILKELHRLRENQGGYNQDFDEYFNQYKDIRVTTVTNLGGKIERYHAAETQQRILGRFEFGASPEEGSKSEADTWTISFSYKVEYDRPTACVLDYPLMVHNQLLSTKYRPDRTDSPPRKLEDKNQSFSLSLYYFNKFESEEEYKTISRKDGLSVPDFDEFIPLYITQSTIRIVTYLIQLTLEDRHGLFNLKELPAINLKKELHTFLLKEGNHVTIPTDSVFNIQLFENDANITYKSFNVVENHELVSLFGLDIRKTYHVRLGIYTDWSLLTKDALDRLRQEVEVVRILLGYIYPYLKDIEIATVNKGKVIPLSEMERIIKLMNREDDNLAKYFRTVETLFVDALRYPTNDKATIDNIINETKL